MLSQKTINVPETVVNHEAIKERIIVVFKNPQMLFPQSTKSFPAGSNDGGGSKKLKTSTWRREKSTCVT